MLSRLLRALLSTALPLIGNILKPLAKSLLIPLGLTAAASATDTATHKKMFGPGFTTLIISNEEMNDIMKIVKCLEEFGLLIKGVSETIKNEAKEQKGGFPKFNGVYSRNILPKIKDGSYVINLVEFKPI